MIGRTLSHYRILEEIGSGGMGRVYLAEDTKLGREVALKVLPPEVAESEERRLRFEREARAVAALNHPNIVTVHSIEEADGVRFITMERVRGKNLAELLPRNGLPLSRFFAIAVPLADAVAAAHREGITHRDLKPENVMVDENGRVKVLDFGLAKLGPALAGRGSELPTASHTGEGRVVGTVHYMSPEQAAGRAIDSRSDIFSLGVVFYEMLTGERPFEGDTPTTVLSSILKDSPRPLSELRPAIPRQLARGVHRCLAKDPLSRYQSAVDLRHDLEGAKEDVDSGDLTPTPTVANRRWAVVAIAASAVVAVLALLWSRDERGSLAVPRLQNAFQVTSALGVENYPTWSPDGGRLAFHASPTGYFAQDHDIWVAQIGGGEPVNLTQDHPGDNRFPSWSPDGRQIAFFSDRGGEWGLYAMASIGGSPRNVLALPAIDGQVRSRPLWSSDGAELFFAVREVDENVLVTVTLESLETSRDSFPAHEGNVVWDVARSPDGSRIAYLEGQSGGTELTRLWTIPAAGGEPVPLTDGRTNVWSPTWSKDGENIFFVSNRGGSMDLWMQPIGEDGAPLGEPQAVTQGLGIRASVFSPDGTKLAYSKGRWVSNVWRAPLRLDRPVTWADAKPVTSQHAYVEFVDVSPDGKSLAVSSDRSGNQDIWVLPAEGGEMIQLTTDPTPDWCPRWSPDGDEIVFYSYRSGNRDIWVMPSRGGPARQLTSDPAQEYHPRWSRDGEQISFLSRKAGNSDLWIVDSNGEGEPRSLTASPEDESDSAWSPDGLFFFVGRQDGLYRVSRRDGKLDLLAAVPAYTIRMSAEGETLYSFGMENLWAFSLADGKLTQLTDLKGRRGRLGYIFDTDGRYLYFTWYEAEMDIWVMDVVPEE